MKLIFAVFLLISLLTAKSFGINYGYLQSSRLLFFFVVLPSAVVLCLHIYSSCLREYYISQLHRSSSFYLTKLLLYDGKCSMPSPVISFFLRSTTNSYSCPVILNDFGNLTLYRPYTRFSREEEGSLYAQTISLSPKSRQQVFKYLLEVVSFAKEDDALVHFRTSRVLETAKNGSIFFIIVFYIIKLVMSSSWHHQHSTSSLSHGHIYKEFIYSFSHPAYFRPKIAHRSK